MARKRVTQSLALGMPRATYPASIAAAGLQSVWDLAAPGATGPRTAPTKVPGVDTLPTGYTASGTPGVGYGQQVTGSTAASFSGWDFTGWGVAVDGDVAVSFTDCKFSHSGGPRLLAAGENSGSPGLTVSYCEFDGTGSTTLFEATVKTFTASTWTGDHNYWHDGSGDYMTQASSGAFSETRSYFKCPGKLSGSGAHLETVHIHQATNTFDHCLIDVRDGIGSGLGAFTGMVYPEADVAAITLNLTSSVIVGASTVGSNWTVQYGGAFGCTLNVTGCVLGIGTSGYFTLAGGSGTLNKSGNYDFDTAAAIP